MCFADKASNPVNLMELKESYGIGGNEKSSKISISSSICNVLFSDGSLVYSFNKRIERQPIVAPLDIKRYVTPEESVSYAYFQLW